MNYFGIHFKTLCFLFLIFITTSCSLLDFENPSITITSHQNEDSVSSPFLLSGTVDDNFSIKSVEYRIDSGEYASVEGTSSWNILIVGTTGNHIISIKATDNNENIAFAYIELDIQ